MKAKWLFPFLPWLSVGALAARNPAYAVPFEGRILHVVGCVVFSIALLAVIQPWREDLS